MAEIRRPAHAAGVSAVPPRQKAQLHGHGVCALYRVVFQNVSKEDAIHEMTEGGFGFHRIYKNIIRRIKEADIEQIRRKVMCTEGF